MKTDATCPNCASDELYFSSRVDIRQVVISTRPLILGPARFDPDGPIVANARPFSCAHCDRQHMSTDDLKYLPRSLGGPVWHRVWRWIAAGTVAGVTFFWAKLLGIL